MVLFDTCVTSFLTKKYLNHENYLSYLTIRIVKGAMSAVALNDIDRLCSLYSIWTVSRTLIL